MKTIVTKKIADHMKLIDIHLNVGDVLESYDDKKLQQLKLIWKASTHIAENCFNNLRADVFLGHTMIEGMLTRNALVKYNGVYLNPEKTRVRASLQLKNNTRKSYNNILDCIKEAHFDKNKDDYFEFWKDDLML